MADIYLFVNQKYYISLLKKAKMLHIPLKNTIMSWIYNNINLKKKLSLYQHQTESKERAMISI